MEPDYQVQGHCIRSPRNPTSILLITKKKKDSTNLRKSHTMHKLFETKYLHVATTWQ